MGIHGLTKLIQSKSPDSIETTSFKRSIFQLKTHHSNEDICQLKTHYSNEEFIQLKKHIIQNTRLRTMAPPPKDGKKEDGGEEAKKEEEEKPAGSTDEEKARPYCFDMLPHIPMGYRASGSEKPWMHLITDHSGIISN